MDSRVEHLRLDLRCRTDVERALRRLRPDVVFHVAAQRVPGRAERDVHETVATNVLGTANLVEAALRADVPRFVYASTGKALYPFTSHVYASTKRVGEWLTASYGRRSGAACAIARFTHVVDNSLVEQHFRGGGAHGVFRLHSPDIRFYVQSRLEAAQLILASSWESSHDGAPVHAIRDLGHPIGLLDLALGVIARRCPSGILYVSGFDRGYQETVFPGLYDPETAVDVSPLFNAFEAHAARPAIVPNVDRAPARFAEDASVTESARSLARMCESSTDAVALRRALRAVSLELLRATLAAAPGSTVEAVQRLTEPHVDRLSEDDAVAYREVVAATAEGARRA
jgi:hypothetical protein